jgi:uncharacterized membrane protein
MSSFIQQSIEVNVPVSVAYNQWTQFEEFPRFMPSIQSIEQRDPRHLHWCITVAGDEREWDAEITEQIPDQRIAWRSTRGVQHAGVLTFHHIAADRSRVSLQLEYEPTGFVENAAHYLGVIEHEVAQALDGFRSFIERRGAETGAWREELPRRDARDRRTDATEVK